MNPEILSQLILAVALAIVSLVFWALRELIKVGIEYLKSKIGQTNYERLRAYAAMSVKAIEQSPVYKDFTGDKKKELVKVAVLQFAKEHNLPVDDALYDKFIEAAVQEMNSQMGKIDWTAIELLPGANDQPMVGSGASKGSDN
jgi:hypothetical protein